ncbi:MAG: 23S rRNA pseudouridine(955/2504/2580) synthase RluC [Candidatus Sedimenticola endophacoides]
MSEPQHPHQKASLVTVEPSYEGQRIDNFLITCLKGVPRTHVYRILRKGEVRVNKGRIKANYRIKAGDVVRIPPLRLPPKVQPPAPGQRVLDLLASAVVYEDKRLLVLNKPSGLAVHGGSGLDYGVIEALRVLRPRERELELVHRLDRDTSGCLLVARRRSALRALHELIRENRVDKRYLALLAGSWTRDKARVEAPLLKNTLKSGERVVRVDPRGKPATTLFSVRARFPGATLVEARLLSGRTHQIRVHARHLGTPILGDTKYGDDEANRRARDRGLRRLFLHAESLRFRLPDEEGDLVARAPLEPGLADFLESLKRDER